MQVRRNDLIKAPQAIVRVILNRKKVNPTKPVFTGKKYVEKPSLQLYSYNREETSIIPEFDISELNGFHDQEHNHWLNIHGLHDVELVTNICGKLEIHPLVIQDILDTNQRPKFQEFDEYCFFTLKSVSPTADLQVVSEQLSFLLGRNYLVSFQEKKGDYFQHVRQRIKDNLGIVNHKGPDYLLFLLLESILDNYFATIDNIEKNIETFGIIDINSDPSPDILNDVEQFKREIHLIRKTLIPIKEFIAKVELEQFKLIHKKQIKYFLELKDLCLTLLDSCDQIEVRLESNINLFFSIQGHRMNQVMKTLTVVATIFIPLTFIAGVYGMNFANMPELNWKWGYFIVWGIMFLVSLVMLYYFRRKKWF